MVDHFSHFTIILQSFLSAKFTYLSIFISVHCYAMLEPSSDFFSAVTHPLPGVPLTFLFAFHTEIHGKSLLLFDRAFNERCNAMKIMKGIRGCETIMLFVPLVKLDFKRSVFSSRSGTACGCG